jgi:hypothetical protein
MWYRSARSFAKALIRLVILDEAVSYAPAWRLVPKHWAGNTVADG